MKTAQLREELILEVTERVWAKIKKEQELEEERKREKRRISLEVEAMFSGARRKLQKALEERGRRFTISDAEDFNLVTKTALAHYGYKSARVAYINGLGPECNKFAEDMIEVLYPPAKK